ncbi:MAG: ArsB/NhaD family transporter [Alphaproteobacteria bacterium]|nr:ArsB/NhaD family transporter [Alphaproteobacteria bacterium]MDD9919216.1 ArsB/NhaD family transporter [Alphaproteobacteria bacterium]
MSIHAQASGGELIQSLATVDTTTLITAISIFVLTYAVILTERINRAIVSLLGAGLMILLGVMTQAQAAHAVDFNTLGLLLGMMVIVAITKESGIFQYVAIRTSQLVQAKPMGILVMLSLVTAVFSGLLDNVTTVLLVTPVILLITREISVKPYPYLFTAILSSNIGGSGTLIGDPPNIMIGSAAGLGFSDFVINVAPLSTVVFVLTMIPICLIWRKDLVTTEERQERIMKMDANAAIKDKELLIKALGVLSLVLLGFTLGHSHGMEPATVAMFGAALLLLLDNIHYNSEIQHERVHRAIAEAEWVTLMFFLGLFILVFGLERVGVIAWMADHLMAATGGDFVTANLLVLWGSAILSALVDNIPFVATMIPLLENMEHSFGDVDFNTMWWSLSIGACLGGNGSLVGASANLVVAGFAEKAGHRISFLKFMLWGMPLMLWSILIATGYILLRYL